MQIYNIVAHKFKGIDDLVYAFQGTDEASLSRLTIAELRQTLKIIKEHHGKDTKSIMLSYPNFMCHDDFLRSKLKKR